MAKIIVSQDVPCSIRELKEFYDKVIEANIDPDSRINVMIKWKPTTRAFGDGGLPETESICMSVER